VDEDEDIEVPGIGGRKPKSMPRSLLVEIIEPRVEELFSLIKREIYKSQVYDSLASGIVLTGGTVIMEGMVELAEEIFELPVRRGCPKEVGGLYDVVNSPMYATAVGLVLYGSKNIKKDEFPKKDKMPFDNVLKRMKEWMIKFF
jgi:cell division protein FtsA